MPVPCLAATGSSVGLFVTAGLGLLVAGTLVLRFARLRLATLAMVLVAGFLVVQGPHAAPARAACEPAPSGLISGTFTFSGSTNSAADLPTITATDGTTTLTATWGAPQSDGVDTNVPFAFVNATPGQWSFEVNQTGTTDLEFYASSLNFSINSSPMLTGGPFNATTSALSVPAGGLTFTFSVTA